MSEGIYMKHFGEKVREKRNDLKLTQTEVGEKINVSRQTISSWENGKSYPDIPMLVTLSDFYDLSLDYLLKEDNSYMSKLKKENNLLRFLRMFFVIQIIVAISVGARTLIISGNTLIGMLSSLVIFVITFYIMLVVNKKYIKEDKKISILSEELNV